MIPSRARAARRLPHAARAGRGRGPRPHRARCSGENGYRVEFSTTAWSATARRRSRRSWTRSATGSAARSPRRAVVPTMLPAFTDSRWFRDAFPECVAYGFYPAAPHDAARQLRAGARARRADRRARPRAWRAVLPRPSRGCSLAMSEQAPPRRDGPAQRAARPRPDALGGGGAHARRASCRWPPAPSRELRAFDGVPGVRGVARLGEAMAVIPLVKRALPEARAALRGRRAWRSPLGGRR